MSATRLALWAAVGLLVVAAGFLVYRSWTTPNRAIVVIEWTTASELDTAGFNLYRSESPDGPFTRINPQLIPASSDPLIGGSYVYTDTHVVAGQTYYYQLEDVETSGRTTRHGPVAVRATGGGRTSGLLVAGLMLLAALGLAAVGHKGLQRFDT